jgi:hypothetical protein
MRPRAIPDISEAQYGQGDLVRAAMTIAQHKLPLTSKGAAECERLMREFGEGNRALWGHPHYLHSTISMAQEIVRAVRRK